MNKYTGHKLLNLLKLLIKDFLKDLKAPKKLIE
jgi:hypothetical protein